MFTSGLAQLVDVASKLASDHCVRRQKTHLWHDLVHNVGGFKGIRHETDFSLILMMIVVKEMYI
jgi:hypothetical protein